MASQRIIAQRAKVKELAMKERVSASYSKFDLRPEKVKDKSDFIDELKRIDFRRMKVEDLHRLKDRLEHKFNEYYPHNILSKVHYDTMIPQDKALSNDIPVLLSDIKTILSRYPPAPPPPPVAKQPSFSPPKETPMDRLGITFGIQNEDQAEMEAAYLNGGLRDFFVRKKLREKYVAEGKPIPSEYQTHRDQHPIDSREMRELLSKDDSRGFKMMSPELKAKISLKYPAMFDID